MKILLLTSRFPFPPVGGDKLRVYNICKHLRKRHEVSIICFAEHPIQQAAIDQYRDVFSEIDVVVLPRIRSYLNCLIGFIHNRALQIAYYRSAAMKKLIQIRIAANKYDVILVHLIRMAEYVKEYRIRKILDMTDAQSLNYVRSLKYRRGFGAIINRVEARQVRDYESKIWKYFDKTLVVSPVDCDYLRRMEKEMNVEVLPNGVDIEKYSFRVNDHGMRKLCFLGNMRTYPNTDAVVWFCKDILPIIRSEMPDVEFNIIGAEPSRGVSRLARIKNVSVTGAVADVSKFVHDSAVAVVPMRVGAGVQNKILESMALGTPVVTTSIGLEGIACTPGEHVVVADSPQTFAREVLDLIRSRRRRILLSRSARKLVEDNYKWEKTLKKLDAIIA